MAKQIIIYKCEECPHALFDAQDLPEHWSEWVCTADATEPHEYKLLTEREVNHGPMPEWCPLDDYR